MTTETQAAARARGRRQRRPSCRDATADRRVRRPAVCRHDGFTRRSAELIERHAVEVAVLDIELRGGSALKALPALLCALPATHFLIHSGHSNPR